MVAGGSVVLVAVAIMAILALAQQGGQPGSAAAGTQQATTGTGHAASGTGQAGATAGQAGAPASAPKSVTATGRGSASATLPTHTGNAHGTTAAGAPPAATKPATSGTPSSRTRVVPTAPGTSGELPPVAAPPASPTNPPNPVPPVPAMRAVTVSAGPAIQPATNTCSSGMVCYGFRVSVTNFPADVVLAYTCADAGGIWWGPGTIVNSGTIVTNSSGDAGFVTYCTRPADGATVTINVGGGGLTASGS